MIDPSNVTLYSFYDIHKKNEKLNEHPYLRKKCEENRKIISQNLKFRLQMNQKYLSNTKHRY